MDFCNWLETKLGTTKWVVAQRLTPRMIRSGYELALTQKRFRDLKAEWQSLAATP
jgi:hypothetical protein